jgi:drug/metabolite transporter (DMT)-like permease
MKSFTRINLVQRDALIGVCFALLAAVEFPAKAILVKLAIAIYSTVLPVFMLSFAIRRIGSGSSSLIGTIGPVSTIYLAYVFLGEQVSTLQIAGSALVLCGVLIISLNSGKEK